MLRNLTYNLQVVGSHWMASVSSFTKKASSGSNGEVELEKKQCV